MSQVYERLPIFQDVFGTNYHQNRCRTLLPTGALRIRGMAITLLDPCAVHVAHIFYWYGCFSLGYVRNFEYFELGFFWCMGFVLALKIFNVFHNR